jgi:hypothetical protein
VNDLSKATPISAGSGRIGGPLCLYDRNGDALAQISGLLPNREQIALDFIKAVNLHDELIEALHQAGGCISIYAPQSGGLDIVRAALAKARA